MRLVAVIFVVVGFATGCASGPKLVGRTGSATPSEAVSVRTESQNEHVIFGGLDQRIYITAVDGEPSIPGCPLIVGCPQEVLVAPGRHYLKLRFQYLNKVARSEVWFDAEEGKSYVVRRRLAGDGVQLWMEETGTGRTVGGMAGSERDKQ